jgi:hypothetical protein
MSLATIASNDARDSMLICEACGAKCGLWRGKVRVSRKGLLNPMARHLRENPTCRITPGETPGELVANFRKSAV